MGDWIDVCLFLDISLVFLLTTLPRVIQISYAIPIFLLSLSHLNRLMISVDGMFCIWMSLVGVNFYLNCVGNMSNLKGKQPMPDRCVSFRRYMMEWRLRYGRK